jgi:chemotaxis protein histidine kinase CheA
MRSRETAVSFEDHIRTTLERITAALRTELEREFSTVSDQLTRAVADERDRREAAQREIEALKRALAEERDRGAQQAAENAAADMRRQAEAQAQIAQIQDAARRNVEEIQRSAVEERERAVQQAVEAASAEVQKHADVQIAQLRDAAQKQAEEINRAAEDQVNELRNTLRAQLEDVRRAAQAETEDARRTADASIEHARRVAAAQVDDALRVAAAQVEEALRAGAAQVDDAQRRAEEQLAETRRDLEAQLEEVRRGARADAEKAQRDLEAARAEADAAVRNARAEAEDVVIAQLTAAQAEAEQKIDQAVDRTRTDAHQADLAHIARLVDAIRRLDDTRSLSEALDALADCAARQVERAAVLMVKGDTLRIRRLAGFGAERPAGDLDIDSAGLAGAVLSTGVTVSRPAVEPGDAEGSRQPALPSFARNAGARHAVALPITVGGRVVAVLYADATPAHAPSDASRWPATLEVLARHASRVLEAMTMEQATGLLLPRRAPRATRGVLPGPLEHGGTGEEDSARRYARLLVSEIRMYHEPLVDAGRRSRDLRSRLGGEIDRARRLYEERVPQIVRDRSDYFEQELIRTLADGDRSLLG